jgi:glutamate racemase
MPSQNASLGLFDSGVGGLSILQALHHQIPEENLLYIADQAHVPYGSRPLAEVRDLAEGITRYLLAQGAKLIVVACNTASAAALHHLRVTFPNIPFVGMEPAVKPAAETTRTGKVGVLATPATFQGELYASVLERFAQDVVVYQDTCAGLVDQIENGQLDSPVTRRILKQALEPMLNQGIDRVVLGCTHYPFVIPQIKKLAGPDVQVINPAPAIARQAARLLASWGLRNPGTAAGTIELRTTGDPDRLQSLLPHLLAEEAQRPGAASLPRVSVGSLKWQNFDLYE